MKSKMFDSQVFFLHFSRPWTTMEESDNEAPKDPGVRQQRYTEQDYEGKMFIILFFFFCRHQKFIFLFFPLE